MPRTFEAACARIIPPPRTTRTPLLPPDPHNLESGPRHQLKVGMNHELARISPAGLNRRPFSAREILAEVDGGGGLVRGASSDLLEDATGRTALDYGVSPPRRPRDDG